MKNTPPPCAEQGGGAKTLPQIKNKISKGENSL